MCCTFCYSVCYTVANHQCCPLSARSCSQSQLLDCVLVLHGTVGFLILQLSSGSQTQAYFITFSPWGLFLCHTFMFIYPFLSCCFCLCSSVPLVICLQSSFKVLPYSIFAQIYICPNLHLSPPKKNYLGVFHFIFLSYLFEFHQPVHISLSLSLWQNLFIA